MSCSSIPLPGILENSSDSSLPHLPMPQAVIGKAGVSLPPHSLQELLDELILCQQLLRGWHGGHGELVLHWASLGELEGGLAGEDRLSMLDGLYRANRETLPCTGPLHFVQHRHFGVPWDRKGTFCRWATAHHAQTKPALEGPSPAVLPTLSLFCWNRDDGASSLLRTSLASQALPGPSRTPAPRPRCPVPRFLGRTCPHEVAVQRVHLLVAAHGMRCRHQRLPHDLPAEEALRGGHPVVPAPAGRRRPR